MGGRKHWQGARQTMVDHRRVLFVVREPMGLLRRKRLADHRHVLCRIDFRHVFEAVEKNAQEKEVSFF